MANGGEKMHLLTNFVINVRMPSAWFDKKRIGLV